MADDAILSRLDAHMERGNEIMARSDETMAQCREEFRLNREFHAKTMKEMSDFHTKSMEESREFHHMTLLRLERWGRDQAREMNQVIQRLDRQDDRLVDLLDEDRAQRAALLAMIDRMNRLDPPG